MFCNWGMCLSHSWRLSKWFRTTGGSFITFNFLKKFDRRQRSCIGPVGTLWNLKSVSGCLGRSEILRSNFTSPTSKTSRMAFAIVLMCSKSLMFIFTSAEASMSSNFLPSMKFTRKVFSYWANPNDLIQKETSSIDHVKAFGSSRWSTIWLQRISKVLGDFRLSLKKKNSICRFNVVQVSNRMSIAFEKKVKST